MVYFLGHVSKAPARGLPYIFDIRNLISNVLGYLLLLTQHLDPFRYLLYFLFNVEDELSVVFVFFVFEFFSEPGQCLAVESAARLLDEGT